MAFPDPVALTIAYLDPIVAPVTVAARVTKPRPDKFVQVRRVGGPTDPPVRDRPRIDFTHWAPTEPEAMALALTVREALYALPGTDTLGVVVYRIDEFMGPRMDDDQMTGTPQVWMTYSLLTRADDAIQPAP